MADPVRIKLASHLCVTKLNDSKSHLGELVDAWRNGIVFDGNPKFYGPTVEPLLEFLQGPLELTSEEANGVLIRLTQHFII